MTVDNAPPIIAGRPGGYAEDRYETQRRAWVKRNKKIFLALHAIVASVFVTSLVVWIYWPITGWLGGLLTGVTLGLAICVQLSPPLWIQQWQMGAWGEQRTAAELSKLGAGWTVVHDVQREGGANFDHVVVGPSGVYLIETKNYGSSMQADGDTLTVLASDGRPRQNREEFGRAVRASAAELHSRLRDQGAGQWVAGVVVLWGGFPQGVVDADRFTWVDGARLSEWLANRPKRCNQELIERAAQVVGRWSQPTS